MIQHLTVFLPRDDNGCDNGDTHHELHNILDTDTTLRDLAIPDGTPVTTCNHGHWVIADHTDAPDA